MIDTQTFPSNISVFHDTGNYIYIPPRLYLSLVLKSILLQNLSAASSEIYTRPRLYLRLVLKSILFQDLSAAGNEIYTRPRLCLTLVLKSILPNIVSAASSKLLVVLSNYFLIYVFS